VLHVLLRPRYQPWPVEGAGNERYTCFLRFRVDPPRGRHESTVASHRGLASRHEEASAVGFAAPGLGEAEQAEFDRGLPEDIFALQRSAPRPRHRM